jgi:hypothetical protein
MNRFINFLFLFALIFYIQSGFAQVKNENISGQSYKGTNLKFEERYTESGPQTKEALEAQVKEHNDMLNKLKMKLEM